MPETIYFDKPGPANTQKTLELAYKRSKELSIDKIVLSSSSGSTAVAASKIFKPQSLVIVTHSTGFEEKDVQEFPDKLRKDLEKSGCRVLTCQHALGGINRAVRRKLNTYQLDEIIAYTLRILGQGFKVCLEIACMTADAGLVSVKKECICIGGTGTGADTAIVLTPANAQSFFDLKVHEIICKPRL